MLVALLVFGLIATGCGALVAAGIVRVPAGLAALVGEPGADTAAAQQATAVPAAGDTDGTDTDAEPGASGTPGDATDALDKDADASKPRIAALPDPKWVREVSQAHGIPERAMRAYAGAAIRLEATNPGCGIGWNTLAAIGEVESHHGTLQGGHVTSGGQVKPRIVGVPLNGNGVDYIADTDGGELDDDPALDRAVGPMQFTPQTWREYGADGNGDGVRDPQHIDDAALAAGEYLCSVGGDLTVSENWLAAVSAYNSPTEYAVRVSEAATRYAG